MTPDPLLDELRRAAHGVRGCVGERYAAILPDGRVYLAEAVADGEVTLTLARDTDDVLLWILPTRGEA